MKYFFFSFLMLSLFSLKAQTQDDIAIAFFQKAQTAFNIQDYETAYEAITQSENALGTTNSKLLYLKIKILQQRVEKGYAPIQELQLACAQFFEVTDKKAYAVDKYSEVVLIDVSIKSRLKQEEEEFNRVQNSADINEMEIFMRDYPKSPYISKLQNRYNELKKEQLAVLEAKAKERADADRLRNEKWKEDNRARYRSAKAGKALVVTGAIGLVGGFGMLVGGAMNNFLGYKGLYGDGVSDEGFYDTKYYIKKMNTTEFENSILAYRYYDERIDINGYSEGFYNYDKYLIDQKTLSRGFGLMVSGAVFMTYGLVALPLGTKLNKLRKRLDREGSQRGVQFGFVPLGTGGQFTLTF